MTVKIRPSQFILTYGPGAILETRDGPRIMLDACQGLFSRNDVANMDLRIIDERMSSMLLSGDGQSVEIRRLPSRSDRAYNKLMYRTNPFPVWKICVNSKHGSKYVLHKNDRCPECGEEKSGAVRYVAACTAGHLDEVDWYYAAHYGGEQCDRKKCKYFYWTDGDTVSKTRLECPECNSVSNFGNVYYGGLACRGREPHKEPHKESGSHPIPGQCDKKANVIQRQALSLRIPETKTIFSLGSAFTELHKYLSVDNIRLVLLMQEPSSKDELLNVLEKLASKGEKLGKVISEVRKADDKEALRAINDIVQPTAASPKRQAKDFDDLLKDEFSDLVNASRSGAPPERRPGDRSRVLFEVDSSRIRSIECGANGTKFLVTPIKRLRTITVQHGFRRAVNMDDDGFSDVVDVGFRMPNSSAKVYLGVEFLGEGIFLRLADGEAQTVTGDAAGRWAGAADTVLYKNPYIFRSPSKPHPEMDPVFVWWHTLSHALIKTVGEYAGYSSAAIRERVYLGSVGGKKAGGLIMYATQPGNDGTLGSLISLVPHFKDIMKDATERAEMCSGDPLCMEQRFANGRLNGAACYSCMMNSETSCEHHNMWLDRRVLLENEP